MMEDIIEVLEKALKSEKRTYDIYRRAAGKAEMPEIRTLFELLARDELRHHKALESELRLLREDPGSIGRATQAGQRSTELDVFMYGAKAARRKDATAENAQADVEALDAAREMAIAAEVQANLLPKELPTVPGVDLAGYSVSARQVGGDYYDAVYNPTTKSLGLVIGDVMGKGFGAALLMANVRAAWRANYIHGLSPDWILDIINKSMYLDFSQNTSFVTLFTGTYYTDTRNLAYSSAGHNPPLLLRADAERPVEIGSPGMAIGVESTAIYLPQALDLAENDVLLFYTDGLLDVWGRDMDIAIPAISDVLQTNRALSAPGVLAQLTGSVAENQTGLTDDVSCLVMKVVSE